ncbi:hypothetical protein D9M68_536070 [compost metagenome]
MKGITYLLLFFSTICLTCKKPAENEKKKTMVCAEKPLELPWIKDIMEGRSECPIYKGAVIFMYASENETLFLLGNPSSLGKCTTLLYNCEGKIVLNFWGLGAEKYEEFEAAHPNRVIIWVKN